MNNRIIRAIAADSEMAFWMIGIGVMCILASLWMWHSDRQFAARAMTTTGRITGFIEEETSGRNGMTVYTVQFAFTTADGRDLALTSRASITGSPSHAVGSEVRVLYDPAKPERAVIDSFIERSLLSVVCGLFGSLFLVLWFWKALR